MAISDRGFASMDDAKQRKIAKMGGQASGTSRATSTKRGAAGRTAAAKRGGKNSHRT